MIGRIPRAGRVAGLICAAGLFSAAGAAYYALSSPARLAPAPDAAALQADLAGLGDATPAALSRLRLRVSDTRARLPSPGDFEAWMRGWSGNWTVLARSDDTGPDLVVRRYAMAFNHPGLGAWSDIVGTVRTLCSEPGLTVDSLSLAAAPDGADAFVEAQITLTVRLRP
jgi:hypothetical protein